MIHVVSLSWSQPRFTSSAKKLSWRSAKSEITQIHIDKVNDNSNWEMIQTEVCFYPWFWLRRSKLVANQLKFRGMTQKPVRTSSVCSVHSQIHRNGRLLPQQKRFTLSQSKFCSPNDQWTVRFQGRRSINNNVK